MDKKRKELYKKIAIRVAAILILYFIVVFTSQFFVNKVYDNIAPNVFSEPLITITPFLDDFVTAQFSCQGNMTEVNFIVQDEYGNIRHNSSARINCNTFTKVSLQGSPLDYTKDRKYIVYALFDNQTINSGYFEFENYTSFQLIKKEIYSCFAFMISQNKLARGTYSDRERLLFIDTGDYKYARTALQSNAIGVLYAFTIFFIIDIGIWTVIGIRKMLRKVRRK